MKIRILSILIIAFFSLNCGPQFYSLKPAEDNNNIENVYTNGVAMSISQKNNSKVAISGSIGGDVLTLQVVCANLGDSRINVEPEKIKVVGYDNNGRKKNFRVYDPDEYVSKVQTGLQMAAVSQAFANGMNKNMTQEEKLAKIQQQKNSNALLVKNLSNTFLRTTTLLNLNETISGNVMAEFDSDFANTIKILVPIGTEKHEFSFSLKEISIPVQNNITNQDSY